MAETEFDDPADRPKPPKKKQPKKEPVKKQPRKEPVKKQPKKEPVKKPTPPPPNRGKPPTRPPPPARPPSRDSTDSAADLREEQQLRRQRELMAASARRAAEIRAQLRDQQPARHVGRDEEEIEFDSEYLRDAQLRQAQWKDERTLGPYKGAWATDGHTRTGAETKALQDRDKRNQAVSMSNWNRANQFTDNHRLSDETTRTRTRIANLKVLVGRMTGSTRETYQHWLEREEGYLSELFRRARELGEATSRGYVSPSERWRWTANDQTQVEIANRAITDHRSYMNAQSMMRDLGDRAETGDLASRRVAEGLAFNINRYAENLSYRMIRAGNELEAAYRSGDMEKVQDLLNKNATLKLEYRSVMGDPSLDNEGTLAAAYADYNRYTGAYNKAVQDRWNAAHPYNPEQREDAALSNRTQWQAVENLRKEWLASGRNGQPPGGDFGEWLQDRDEGVRRTIQHANDAVKKVLDQLNSTVGPRDGFHFEIGMDAEGRQTIVPKPNYTHERWAPLLDVEAAAKELGFANKPPAYRTGENPLQDFARSRGILIGSDRPNEHPDFSALSQRAVEGIIEKAIWNWTTQNQFRPEYQGSNAASAQFTADREAKRRAYREIFGLGDADPLNFLEHSPLGIVWDAIQTPLSWLGGGVKDWAYQQGGELDVFAPREGQHTGQYAEQLRGYLERGEITQRRYDNLMQRHGLKPVSLDTSPEALAHAEEDRAEFESRTEAALPGDWQERMRAYNDFGSYPFSDKSSAGNLTFQFLADPMNLIPLNFLTYLSRGRHALAATQGINPILRTPRMAWEFLHVDANKLHSGLDGRLAGHTARDILPEATRVQIRAQIANAPSGTQFRSMIDDVVESVSATWLKRVVGEPTMREAAQLRRLIEDEIGLMIRQRGTEIVNKLDTVDVRAEGKGKRVKGRATTETRVRRGVAENVQRAETKSKSEGRKALEETEARIAKEKPPAVKHESPPAKPEAEPTPPVKPSVGKKPKIDPEVARQADRKAVLGSSRYSVVTKPVTQATVKRVVAEAPEKAKSVQKRFGLDENLQVRDDLHRSVRSIGDEATFERGKGDLSKPEGRVQSAVSERAKDSLPLRIQSSEMSPALRNNPNYGRALAEHAKGNPAAREVIERYRSRDFWQRQRDAQDAGAPMQGSQLGRYAGVRAEKFPDKGRGRTFHEGELKNAEADAERLKRSRSALNIGGNLTEGVRRDVRAYADEMAKAAAGDASDHWTSEYAQQLLQAEVLGAGKDVSRLLYRTFTERPLGRDFPLSEVLVPQLHKILNNVGKADLRTINSFFARVREIMRSGTDDLYAGGAGFAVGGQYLFELFHQLRLGSLGLRLNKNDVALRRIHDAIMKRIEAHSVEGKMLPLDDEFIADATWLVMESRARLPYALDEPYAVALFREAVSKTNMNPSLALAQIPAGYRAVPMPAKTRLGPLLAVVDHPQVSERLDRFRPTESLEHLSDEAVAARLQDTFLHGKSIDESVRTAQSLVKWVAEQGGMHAPDRRVVRTRNRLFDLVAHTSTRGSIRSRRASVIHTVLEGAKNERIAFNQNRVKNRLEEDWTPAFLQKRVDAHLSELRAFAKNGFGTVVKRGKGKVTLSVDFHIRDAFWDAYWKGDVSHKNPSAHIIAYAVRMADAGVNEMGTIDLAFLRHMKGAGVSQEQINDILTYFHGEAIASARARLDAKVLKNGGYLNRRKFPVMERLVIEMGKHRHISEIKAADDAAYEAQRVSASYADQSVEMGRADMPAYADDMGTEARVDDILTRLDEKQGDNYKEALIDAAALLSQTMHQIDSAVGGNVANINRLIARLDSLPFKSRNLILDRALARLDAEEIAWLNHYVYGEAAPRNVPESFVVPVGEGGKPERLLRGPSKRGDPLPEERPDLDGSLPDEAVTAQTVISNVSKMYDWSDVRRLEDELRKLKAAQKAFQPGTPEYIAVGKTILTTAKARNYVQSLLKVSKPIKIGVGKRNAFAKGVRRRKGKEARDLVPEGQVAWHIKQPADAGVELVRSFHSMYRRAKILTGKVTAAQKKVIDDLIVKGPDGQVRFERIELGTADALHPVQGRRTAFLDTPGALVDDLGDDFMVRPRKERPEVVAAKKAYHATEGVHTGAYDEIWALTHKLVTKMHESVRLSKAATAQGGDYDEAFGALRAKRAGDAGEQMLEREARGNLYGAGDNEIMDVLYERFHGDGKIRHKQQQLTPAQAYILERYVSVVTDGLDIKNPDAMAPFLAGNRPLTFMTNAADLKTFLKEKAFWSPRTRRQAEDFGHWTAAEQREYFLNNYAQVPRWLDTEYLSNRGYFDDLDAHRRISRELGLSTDEALVERRLKGESAEDMARRLLEGDPDAGIRGARSFDQERDWWIKTWGEEIMGVGDDGVMRMQRMEWLQNADELMHSLPERMKNSLARQRNLFASQKELAAFQRIVRDVIEDMDAQHQMFTNAPGPVTRQMVTDMAQRIAVQLLHDKDFLPFFVRRGGPSRVIQTWGRFWRALTMVIPAFVGINVVDIATKGVLFGRSVKAWAFSEGVLRANDAIKHVRDFDPEAVSFTGASVGDIGGGLSRKGRRSRLADATQIRYPAGTTASRRPLIKQASARAGSWIEGVEEFFPNKLAGVDEWARRRVGQNVFAQVWDEQKAWATKQVKAHHGVDSLTPTQAKMVDELAVGSSLLRAQIETRRIFFSLSGRTYLERLANELMPFFSYNIRNKLLWLSEAFEHPAWLNRINFLGEELERRNRAEWEQLHPDTPFDERNARLLRVPWMEDTYFDLSILSDATRGLSMLTDAAKTRRQWLGEWFRFMTPAQVAVMHAITDPMGLSGRWKWEYVDGEATGNKVWVPDGEPWSGDPVTLSSVLWPFDVGKMLFDALENGLDLSDITRLVHKSLFYGNILTLDPGQMLNDTYWAIRAQSAEKARDFYNEHNVDLQAFWDSNNNTPRDYYIPNEFNPGRGELDANGQEIKYDAFGRPDMQNWFDRQPGRYRQRIGAAYAQKRELLAGYQLRLDALIASGDFDGAKALRAARRLAINSFYLTHPDLLRYEQLTMTSGEWAQKQADWRLDDMVDTYFDLLGKRPKRMEGESAVAYNNRLTVFNDQLSLFRSTYPNVVDRVRNQNEDIARAQDWQNLIWQNSFKRIALFSIDLEAAKKAGDFDKANLIYKLMDHDSEIFETDVYANVGPPDLRTGQIGGVGLGDLRNKMLRNMTPEEREEDAANRRYVAGMKDVIARATVNGEFNPAKFAQILKQNPELLEAYFDNHPGKREEWAATDEYIDKIKRFGRLAQAGKWDEAYDYFDSLPAWVKSRYYAKHPDAKANEAYRNWWGRFHNLMENGNREAAFDMYRNMPNWVKKQYGKWKPSRPGAQRGDGDGDPRYAEYGAWWDRYHRLRLSNPDAAYRMYGNMPAWVRRRYMQNNPDAGRRSEQSGRYSAYMQRWIKHFDRGDVEGGMNYFHNLPKWVQDRYFASHPGKRDHWARTEQYSNHMQQWINLIEKGNWDRSNAYFWSMPKWIRDRYFQNNPDSGMRRTRDGGGHQQPSRGGNSSRGRDYYNALGGWVNLLKAKKWDEARQYFDSLPEWMQRAYYKNHPENRPSNRGNYKPSPQDAEYSRLMGQWVEFYKAGDNTGAEAFFRTLPEWAQERYLRKHPDKIMLGEDMDMVVKLRDYFGADAAHQAQMVAQFPELLEWVNNHSATGQRISILMYLYDQLPDDEWLKRSFREKYPEVFSEEAQGERRAQAKWDEAGELGLQEEMMAWMKNIAATSEAAARYSQKPPKQMQMVHPRRRRKHTNTYSAADLAAA